jgi:hypothetical protein
MQNSTLLVVMSAAAAAVVCSDFQSKYVRPLHFNSSSSSRAPPKPLARCNLKRATLPSVCLCVFVCVHVLCLMQAPRHCSCHHQ